MKTPSAKVEQALIAYIQSIALTGTPAFEIPVHSRCGKMEDGVYVLEELDSITLPSIVVSCPGSKVHDMGFSECEVHIIVAGSVARRAGVNETPKEAHEELAGWVAAAFRDDNLNEVMTYCNAPDSGPDNRTVKDFRMFGYFNEDPSSTETDRQWMDDTVIIVHCQPTDDTSL